MDISLCMIVKNEEDWIEGAIESVRSIVAEVIILDTGSTDRTLARIRRFHPTVLSYPWNNHFAEARNASLAAATRPWILILDADERIAAADLPKVKEMTRRAAHGFHLVQRNYVQSNQVFGWTANTGGFKEGDAYAGYVDNPLIRLFRNRPDIRFQGAVHEIIDPAGLPHYQFDAASIVIHHFGKVREQERVKAKQQYYHQLGLKKIQENPADAKARFDIAIQCQELGRHIEAAEWFEQAFDMTGQPAALLYWAISEKRQNNFDRAFELLMRALDLGLNTPAVHLELGNIHLACDRLEDANREYRHCLERTPENPVVVFNCGLMLRKLGELNKAQELYERALALDNSFREAALELADLRAARNEFDAAAALLEPVVERDPQYREACLLLAKIHIQKNNPDDALRLLASTPGTDSIARCLLGAAHLQKNNLDDAQTHLEAALRRDRSLVDARINLAQVFTRKGDYVRAARYAQSAVRR
jgi:tetratricopeptide (TPR) repeat protein